MEHIHELMLCEQDIVILRANVLYRFTVAEDCAKCKRLDDAYKEIEN